MLSKIFMFFIAFRVASVFIVQTWYVPDEYWQSLEVAHHLAFGYGHLTWEWTHGIRSYIYPALIAALYKALAFAGLDNVWLLTTLPRLFQALLSAYADYRFYCWSHKSKWSAFVVTTAWFWFYTASRTLGNTLEASLTVIALSYFPWVASESTSFLWPVALSFFVRPTSVIPWVPLCLYHLKKSTHPIWELLVKRYLLIGALVGTCAVAVDSFFHGSLLFTPYEFLRFNIFKGIGSFYGKHPWYWYFNVGLPTILGINTLPFLFAVIETIRYRQTFKERSSLLITVFVTVAIYSALEHKEFRFLLQILPICLYVVADYLSRWSRKASSKLVWLSAIGLLVGNVVPAAYLSYVHQRGTIAVMPHLHEIAVNFRGEFDQPAKFLYLMPCHSTPFQSHIHHNATAMRFLSCEPNFDTVQNNMDEADTFYKDPAGWIKKNIPVYPRSALPTHIIMFDSLEPQISTFLSGYSRIAQIDHAHYTNDRVGNKVVVYEINILQQFNEERMHEEVDDKSTYEKQA